MDSTPTDPTVTLDPSMLPGDIYAGPYGFVVAIAFFMFLAARELRRYREIDNTLYKTEIADLKHDVEQLTAEVASLRDEKFAEARGAAREVATLIRENGDLLRENSALRALCAKHDLDTSHI